MWTVTAWQCKSADVDVKGFKKCSIATVVEGTDDVLWNVRSGCAGQGGTECEMETATVTAKGTSR